MCRGRESFTNDLAPVSHDAGKETSLRDTQPASFLGGTSILNLDT